MAAPFPATPHWFVPISTPSRTRIFLISYDDPNTAPSLTQVTTVNGAPDLTQSLVDALNRAAVTGDRADVDVCLAGLGDAVTQACVQALDSCPSPETIALRFDDQPMTVIHKATLWATPSELATQAEAATDLGLQLLFENSIDGEGQLCFNTKLLSSDREVAPSSVSSWWPAPPGVALLERLQLDPVDLADAFLDHRWSTHRGRAYWLWVKDTEDEDADDWTSTATWVIEFFDIQLSPYGDSEVFIADDGCDEETRGFLTHRTRFLLWLSLGNITADLDQFVGGYEDSTVKDDMPALVQDQPRDWWKQTFHSAERLCDAARDGALADLVPRTPAEEALIALATWSGYVDWARDVLRDHGYQHTFDSLPASPDDEEWGEILGQLTGDTDVEMLWKADLAAMAGPDDTLNQFLGMADYRPDNWHMPFDRARSRD